MEKSVLAAIAVLVGCLAGLYFLQEHPPEMDAEALTVLRRSLVTLLGLATVAIIRHITKIVNPAAPPATPEEPNGHGMPVTDEPAVEQQTEQYKALRHYGVKQKEFIAQLTAYATRLRRNLLEGSERLGALKFAALCGVCMAAMSGVATYLTLPTPATWLSRHVPALAATYAGVAMLFGIVVAATPKAPNIHLPLRVGGLSALYVNLCSVLINLPYTWKFMFGPEASRVGEIPLGYLIVAVRLLLLPAVAIIACWIGTHMGRKWFAPHPLAEGP